MNGEPATGYSDDRYAKQRRLGFRWLRFQPELEAEFRQDYLHQNRGRIRSATMIGLAAVFGFIFMDQFFGLNLQSRASDLLLIAVTVPAILLPMAVTFRQRPGPFLLPLVFVGAVAMSLSIVAVIALGRGANEWFPWESLILVTMYVSFVSGLMYYQAMLCNAITWCAFLATNWTLQEHGKLIYEAYYLLVANAIGWLGHYMIECQMRRGYLLRNELRTQAVSDSLTGLMNRRAFSAHLETAWLQAQRSLTSIGLMLIDLDGFKKINDSCGHQFGDNALQHVAHVLRSSALRPLDAAGRYGGDEFIAVWYDVDGGWFGKLVNELPARLEGLECGDPKNPHRVTVSGGAVVAWPRPGMTMRDAIKAADEKLYHMKREGRGTIGFVVLGSADNPQARQQQTAA